MITQAYLKRRFFYKNGNLFSRSTNQKLGWNDRGYRRCWIDKKRYHLHRLIWLYHKGSLPEQLDHKDQNKANNKISNLRICTHSLNRANSVNQRSNRYRFRGVRASATSNKYKAVLVLKGAHKYLGTFKTVKEAALAYNKAARKHFGSFAFQNRIK